jgi:hypothetical protein
VQIHDAVYTRGERLRPRSLFHSRTKRTSLELADPRVVMTQREPFTLQSGV